jgi:hypothetical protein
MCNCGLLFAPLYGSYFVKRPKGHTHDGRWRRKDEIRCNGWMDGSPEYIAYTNLSATVTKNNDALVWVITRVLLIVHILYMYK